MPQHKGFPKPVVKVWCLPHDLGEMRLNNIFHDIVASFTVEPKLNVDGEKDMVVLFPSDLMSYGLGTEIIIEVESATFAFFGDDVPCSEPNIMAGQLDEARRVGRFHLASRLVMALGRHFPEAYIQCRVYSEDRPHDGFGSSEPLRLSTE